MASVTGLLTWGGVVSRIDAGPGAFRLLDCFVDVGMLSGAILLFRHVPT